MVHYQLRNAYRGLHSGAALTGLALTAFLVGAVLPARGASKSVDLNADGTAESTVALSVISTSPVKIQNKITNRDIGQAFTFRWPSAGPGGFSSSLGAPPSGSTGVGTIWTWQTSQSVYSFTGSTCDNDACFTRTIPADNLLRPGGGVPGRSLTTSGVTLSNASLSSSLLTFFSPPAVLFEFTSKIDELAPGVFRYTTLVDNHTSAPITINSAPQPLGCNSYCGYNGREGSEVCDGSDLGGQSCASLGGTGGTLGCQADCRHFDISQCTGICGNGVREASELCDGSDLGGNNCGTVGGDGSGTEVF